MKKTYQKPGIYVENFNLSQSIASTCGAANPDSTLGQPGFESKTSCGWDIGSGAIVWPANSVCTFPVKGDSAPGADGSIVCYNNPEGGMNIFGWS